MAQSAFLLIDGDSSRCLRKFQNRDPAVRCFEVLCISRRVGRLRSAITSSSHTQSSLSLFVKLPILTGTSSVPTDSILAPFNGRPAFSSVSQTYAARPLVFPFTCTGLFGTKTAQCVPVGVALT